MQVTRSLSCYLDFTTHSVNRHRKGYSETSDGKTDAVWYLLSRDGNGFG